MKEQQLQSKIIKHLSTDGWLVVKTISLSTNGWPDIFAFKQGMAIFIEVKSPTRKNHATNLQKYRIEQLQKQGFNAEVIYTFKEFSQFYDILCRSVEDFKMRFEKPVM